MTVLQSSLPNAGPGALKFREPVGATSVVRSHLNVNTIGSQPYLARMP